MRTTKAFRLGDLSIKFIVCLLILACLVLGAVGIVLPIIPGLLFLVIGAILLARHFPLTERWLRRHPLISDYLDKADGFAGLDLADKAKLACLLAARILIDSAVYVAALSARIFSRLRPEPRY